MMNHLVPDSKVDEDYPISSSSAAPRPNKSPMAEEDIMELLWQNGQVVMQSQNQRSLKKPEPAPALREMAPPEDEPSAAAAAQQLFMQEDEMASWLHYPIDEPSSFNPNLYSDLFYPPPPCEPNSWATRCSPDRLQAPPPLAASLRPPVPPARQIGGEMSPRVHNFVHFSRGKATRDSTVVGSSVTPAAGEMEVYGGNLGRGKEQVGTSSAAGDGGREIGMCEMTMTSSPGGSGASISASGEPLRNPMTGKEDLKQKGVEVDDAECQSEDLEFESPDAKKQTRGSTSTKRSRAAEVHNLSERRRRDRINEKMRALQELIPRCNKSDKASMLDEAIEYLKSLQMQVQMMSMGCSMVPMMFPGMQQYMPPMGMGMGMGMEMGMNRPMMPFLPMMSGSALPNPATTAHLGQRFPMPGFHMPSVPLHNPPGAEAMNQSNPMINSRPQNLNQPHMPFISDPYQQYLGFQQMPLPQNQGSTQPNTSKPSFNRGAGNREDPKTGR